MAHDLVDAAAGALKVAVWVSLPALLAAWLAGVLTAAVTGATRLGDATTGTVPRQIAVGVALWLSASWAGAELFAFTRDLWAQLGAVGS